MFHLVTSKYYNTNYYTFRYKYLQLYIFLFEALRKNTNRIQLENNEENNNVLTVVISISGQYALRLTWISFMVEDDGYLQTMNQGPIFFSRVRQWLLF